MKNIDMVKHNDWIFTCTMLPEQFDKIIPRDPKDYNQDFLGTLDEEEYSNFINDNFETKNGASHSFKNCGCKVVSETYAKWFLENNIHLLFDKHREIDSDNVWINYKSEVKRLAEEAGLVYEGI